jgi:hypothetical protein
VSRRFRRRRRQPLFGAATRLAASASSGWRQWPPCRVRAAGSRPPARRSAAALRARSRPSAVRDRPRRLVVEFVRRQFSDRQSPRSASSSALAAATRSGRGAFGARRQLLALLRRWHRGVARGLRPRGFRPSWTRAGVGQRPRSVATSACCSSAVAGRRGRSASCGSILGLDAGVHLPHGDVFDLALPGLVQ